MDPPKPKPGPKSIAEIALGSGILKLRKPTAPDIAEVNTAIMEALPPGVPTYAKEVLAVHRKRGTTGGRIIADILLFDDALGRVEISGHPGGRGYRWHTSGIEGTAFHWDDSARRWERIFEEV